MKMESPRGANREGSSVNLAGDAQSHTTAAPAEQIYTLAADAQDRSDHLAALLSCIDDIVDGLCPEPDANRLCRLNQLASLARLGRGEVGRLDTMLQEIEVAAGKLTRVEAQL